MPETMTIPSPIRWRPLLLILALAVLAGTESGAAPRQTLVWRKDRTADAALENWPMAKMLGRLAAVTGWKIFVESGVEQPVSVRFKRAPQSDALKLLFGRINYALVPGSEGTFRLYVYQTSLDAAKTPIDPEQKPSNWLGQELIVVAKPGAEGAVEKLVAELGGEIIAKSDGLNAYRVRFADEAAAERAREELAGREDLELQDNYAYERPASASSNPVSPSVLFPLDSKPVTRGDQITVALIDTPVQPLEGKMKDFVLPSVHVKEAPTSLPADPTHGTSMMQTILHSMAFGGNPGAGEANLGKVRVLPIDIYGQAESTSTFEVSLGLYQAIQSNAQVINLSLGGDGGSPMVDYLLEMAREKQILVFASAGNSPTTDPTWPAANPNAIAVTAADWNGNLAPYANRGSFVDVKAPGYARVYHNGQTYLSTGTSTATAFISGQAAALTARGLPFADAAGAILKNFDFHSAPVQRVRP